MQERVLLDKEIEKLKNHLSKTLSWLDNCYGRAERRKQVTIEDGSYVNENSSPKKTYIYPAIYVSDGEYLNLMPSDSNKNMCFFVVNGRQEIGGAGRSFTIKANMDVIFWVDLKSIYGDEDYHWTENVKYDILSALKWYRGVEVRSVNEEPLEVWDGYTLRDVMDFMMSPYYGIKVGIELTTMQECRKPVPTPTKLGSFNSDFNNDFDK